MMSCYKNVTLPEIFEYNSAHAFQLRRRHFKLKIYDHFFFVGYNFHTIMCGDYIALGMIFPFGVRAIFIVYELSCYKVLLAYNKICHLDPVYYPDGDIVIERRSADPSEVLIDRMTLGGKPLKTYRISHQQLKKNKTLTINTKKQ